MSATIVLACLVVVLSTAAFIIYNLDLNTKEANATVWLGSLVLGASCLASYVPVAANPWFTAQYVVSVAGCGFVCIRLMYARAFCKPSGLEWGTIVAATVAALFTAVDMVGLLPLEGRALDHARVLVPGAAAVTVSFPLCLASWQDHGGVRLPWVLWSLGNIANAVNIAQSDGMTWAVTLGFVYALQNSLIGCPVVYRCLYRYIVRKVSPFRPRPRGVALFFANSA